MLSLYEILKASKTGIAPDMRTALAGMNWGGADSGHEVKELTGIPPLSIRSNGTMLLDYLISGNMSQTGTPTPTTPIQPQETGERMRNVMPSPPASTQIKNDVTFICDGKGKITIRGTASAFTQFKFTIPTFTIPVSVGQGGNGTFSMFNTFTSSSTVIVFYNGTTQVDNWSFSQVNHTNTSYSKMGGKQVTSMILNIEAGATVNGQFSLMFTDDGQLPNDYEPYGYKIPISSANTTTPVYLGEIQTTRRIKKLVLTGEETDWLKASSTYTGCFYKSTPLSAVQTQMYCTHLPYIAVSDFEPGTITISESKRINLWFEQFDNNTTVADFKTYLATQYAAGTPVTVWYVLAEPETAVVNEPLRKIGDHADTVSYEQAGVQIPTNRGNTVIDVKTTLKPSEMYIKYQE